MSKNKVAKNEKIAVLFVTTNLNYNGAKKYIVEVANDLVARGQKVGLLFDGGPLADKLDERIEKHHVDLAGLGIDPVSRIKLIVKSAYLARKGGYRIIHGETANSVLSHKLLKFYSKAKIVETIHHVWGGDKQRRDAVQKIGARADSLITISSSALKVLRSSGLKRQNVRIIQNGINTKGYRRNKTEVDNLRQKLGIGKKDPVLVSVSRVSKAKNFEAFIHWFPFILSEYPNARLVIVGDNGSGSRVYLDSLIKKIRGLKLSKNIICVGGKTFIKNYLSLGHIFTVPTVARGLAVLEAMAAGLPVVASRPLTPTNPEVTIDKQTGLLFTWGDWKRWAEHVKYLLSKPEVAKKYGLAGKKRVETLFTIEKHIDELEKVYYKLVKT